MNTEIISKLHLHDFTVTDRGEVRKKSERTGRTKKVGQINEAGVYFFAQNVHPFKSGHNTTRDILGDNVLAYNPKPYVKVIKLKELSYDFTFEQYLETTKEDNHLGRFLAPHVKTLTNTESNPYDLRGVKNGYMENATLFPYINFDNEFITAKIVKYDTKTGKRRKEKYSNNWFHTYKPIKKELELDLDARITKRITCFFGEHLLKYNDKPVVIVESEKTAIFLSLLYDNIVFIASGGLSNLSRLSHDFLLNRDVYVFPDNGATEWLKIAEKRGWWCSNILEKEGEKGSDIVDYFETELGEDLHTELQRIQERTLHFSSAELNFRFKEKTKKIACLPSFPQPRLTRYFDNAKGRSFRGRHFFIFQDKFNVLSSNIDFNKPQEIPTEYVVNGQTRKYLKKVPVDASEFLLRLEECFRVIKHLNPEENIQEIFNGVIKNLSEYSNYVFNERHIIEELFPMWDNGKNDISEYKKERDWRYCSVEFIEDDEFVSKLSDDKRAFRTNKYLKEFLPMLNKFQYIKSSDLGLKQRRDSSLVWDLMKRYNSEVIGCRTVNQFHKRIELQEYFDFVTENTAILEDNEKSFEKKDTPYNNTYIECLKSGTIFKNPSIQVIFDNTFIDKHTIREYLNFVPNEESLLDIKTTVKYLLDHQNDLKFERIERKVQERIEKRIEVVPLHSIEYMKEEINRIFEREPKKNINLAPAEAFDFDLDLSGSILHCDEAEAIQSGRDFLYSWICFHNPQLTDNEKLYVDSNPMQWILNTGQIVA